MTGVTMSKPPLRKYAIQLCDCRSGDKRGTVTAFYKRKDNQIVCDKCEKNPPEIGPHHIPDDHRVELLISQQLDSLTYRRFREVLHPQ